LEDLCAELKAEELAIDAGYSRFSKKLEDTPFGETEIGVSLLNRALPKFTNALPHLLVNLSRHTPSAHALLLKLTPLEIGVITIKRALGYCHDPAPWPYIRVCRAIGGDLCHQASYNEFRKHNSKLLPYILQELKSQSYVHRARVLNWYFGRFNTRHVLSEELRIHLGIKLLETLVESTGLVEIKRGPQSEYRLEFAEDTLKWILKTKLKCAALDPVVDPMLIPPMNWHGLYRGGFLLNGIAMAFPFIRTSSMSLALSESYDLTRAYNTANILQATPWRVNSYIWQVMQQALECGGLVPATPNLSGIMPPDKPWDDSQEPDRAMLLAWKQDAAKAYTAEHSEKTRRIQFFRKHRLAERLAKLPAFYFCWSTDFRGRFNVIQPWVNPQSDDLGKALLEFARGKPLGDTGFLHLCIHMANEWGYDKCSYRDRIMWCSQHSQQILQSVADPVDYTWWTQADKPWQFLAACKVWADAMRGLDVVSHLPVSSDGSCNGFQHLSAMLRDFDGGSAVNVVGDAGVKPLDSVPQDVYSIVLEQTRRILSDQGVTKWDPHLDRKLIKRNVMTSPYSVTIEGMKDQLRNELLSRGVDDKELLFACRELALVVAKAREQRLANAMSAMEYLKAIAKACNALKIPVVWTTPAGFTVIQYYRTYKKRRVDLVTGSTRVQLQLNGEPQALDTHKQCLGIAPNFVHSLDACHLTMTLEKSHAAGILDYAMVHDSYATHACDLQVFGRCLREAFYELYTTDVLRELKDQTERRLPEGTKISLPDVPQQGTLDLSGVLSSPHFFNNWIPEDNKE
jgi:DNA-directed RNA polymerase